MPRSWAGHPEPEGWMTALIEWEHGGGFLGVRNSSEIAVHSRDGRCPVSRVGDKHAGNRRRACLMGTEWAACLAYWYGDR
ncbi:unnamed protein product [Lasius platythorax]|uniref:Uncharacterized protein n=1 Tax=Lasius platythorax TaxID=488582 RepID=A0AAV2NBD0_9HYME